MTTEPSPRRARVGEPAADPLTSLPPPLLDAILTRLDLPDAVRTSALSRAWRRRWEALPYLCLSFVDNPGTAPLAVDRVLARYPGRISNFSFHVDEHSFGRVDDWLVALCDRGVKSINLRCASPFILHSSLFLWAQLTHLKLCHCGLPPLPVGFTGFPMLKDLKLSFVEFLENGESQLEAILVGSPLLETLNLHFVDIRGNDPYSNVWVIRGANLRSLTINSDFEYDWQVKELPYLDEADIDVGNYVSPINFRGFLASFAQIRKLSLSLCACYASSTGDGLLETLPFTFDNLKSLTLWTRFYEMRSIVLTFCVLRNTPNLEELEITTYGDGDAPETNAEFLNTQWTDAFCANLQAVKMKNIGWLQNEMYFIELVLSKAAVLRTMHLSLGCRRSKSNEDALCELMTYRRASTHARVFFDGKMK
ncbi:F-box/FBD/LRR-repeat protein At1g13570-like isoform X2 [Triticum dicoccoides]|nr:F-box/FBD/LRR-repeat protein At1g13570-like isoform X2 [Triticum dicoccoides]